VARPVLHAGAPHDCALTASPDRTPSNFFQVLGLQHELGAVDLATHFVTVRDFAESNTFDFCALLQHVGGAAYLQVLDQDNAIPVAEYRAVGISYDRRHWRLGRLVRRPLVTAVGADQHVAIWVGVRRAAVGAIG